MKKANIWHCLIAAKSCDQHGCHIFHVLSIVNHSINLNWQFVCACVWPCVFPVTASRQLQKETWSQVIYHPSYLPFVSHCVCLIPMPKMTIMRIFTFLTFPLQSLKFLSFQSLFPLQHSQIHIPLSHTSKHIIRSGDKSGGGSLPTIAAFQYFKEVKE